MELTIYNSNGTAKAAISANDSSVLEKTLMGDNVLTLSFTYHSHIMFDVNDYVFFEGEQYWLMERYSPVMKNTAEWVYDLKMYGMESLMKRFLVLNTTDGDVEPIFILTAPPSEHLRLIVQSINSGMGGTDWKVGSVTGTENIVIEYEGKYCNEALRELATSLNTEWWIEGTTVNLCKCITGSELTLSHGQGLIGLEPDIASNQKVYTRLFPIGSSRNIDPEEYGHNRLVLPNGQKYVDVNVDKYGIIHHYEKEAFQHIFPRRIGVVSNVRKDQPILLSEDFSSITTGNNTSTSGSNTAWDGNDKFLALDHVYKAGGAIRLGGSNTTGSITTKTISAKSGTDIVIQFDVKGWTNVEGNIEIIIPGSHTQNVSYVNTMSQSFVRKSVRFTLAEDNPTVTIATTAKRAFLDNIEIVTDGNTVYYFKDKDLNFDPNDYEIDGLVKHVSFQEGSELAGLGEGSEHYFEVNFDSSTHEFEIITIWPYDDDTPIPGGSLEPKIGDKYILWNIKMPSEYYISAEEELAEAVDAYNAEHAIDVSVYKSKIDHVWMENHTENLKIGRRVKLINDKFFFDTGYRQSRITKITKKVNNPGEMDIEISDVISTGTMTELTNEINSVRQYAKGIKDSISLPDIIKTGDKTEPTDNNLYSAKRSDKQYLKCDKDDTASGHIAFVKGLTAKDNGNIPSISAETIVATNIEAENIKTTQTETENLSVTGHTSVNTINASGKATLHETSVTDFSASGNAEISGDAEIGGKITVSGDADIEGTTTHNGDVLIDNNKSLQSKDFTGGIAGGYGWKIYKDANGQIVAEFDSMILRHFLEVPEFRYNRITVTNGILWVSPAAGLIERVEADTSNPSKGTVYLKLEEGEFSSFAVNDICMGIYHFENGNANTDTDDGHGNFSMKGFSTIYFKVTNVDSNGKWFKYQLGNGSTKHPVASMSIIAYGNTTDTSRQRSLYMTKSYSRYIVNVNDYTFTNDNVAMQWGDLSNLGTGMNGYSMYLNNIYMSGTIKQLKNERGDEIKLINYRGVWDSNTQYYKDDEVFYAGSLWLANNNNKGSEPTDTNTDWQKVSGKGDKGQSSFKSIIFKRTNSTPSTPTGGSYLSPVPSGWSDGVPTGDAQLWMSTRIFTSDGLTPQQSTWTTPRQATDTADIDFEFSSVATNPGNPTSNPSNWHNTATASDIWMAVRKCKNGVWGSWEVSKIKGEKGEQGIQGDKGDKGDDGRGVVQITTYYGLSDSSTTQPSLWETTPPLWQNGRYLWTYQHITYTDDTSTDTAPTCVTGSKGDTGGLIRLRGVWATQTTTSNAYVSNSQWRDVVIYNGNCYIVKEGKTATTQLPTNTTYWEPFNQFENVATSVLLANKGYIDILGTGQAFIGQTQNGAGWYMTQGKIEYRPSASASPTLTLTNDGKIIATDGSQIIVRDGGIERSVWGTIKGLTDGQFSIWQSSDNAPTSSDDIPWNSSLVPSKDWTDKDSHIHDILIFKDGITYRFVFKNNAYVWTIFTDKYLIDVTRNVGDIFADDKITPDEKKELAKIRQELSNNVTLTISKWNELTAEEQDEIGLQYTAWRNKSTSLINELDSYLSDMTTTTTLTSAEARDDLVDLIATVQSLTSEVLRLIEEVKLASTGIDIGNRIIILTADRFKIKNNSGEETLDFNEAGNLNIKGILVKNSIHITSENAKQYLIPSCSNKFCGSDYRSFAYYSALSQRRFLIGSRNYYNGTEAETIDTFSPFCSTEISVPADYTGNTVHTHSLDVLLTDGLVVFDNSLMGSSSNVNSWLASIDQQAANADNIILLPFMQYVSGDNLYEFNSLRTPTSNLHTKHLITINEMRSLVGKRIALCNATNTVLYILCATGFVPSDTAVTSLDLDRGDTSTITQSVSLYNGYIGYVQVASGESIVIEYQQAIQKTINPITSNTFLSADIVPMLIAKTNQAQGYVESMIKASDTFGDEYKITTNNE